MTAVAQEGLQEYIDGIPRGDVPLRDPLIGREQLVRGEHDFAYITERVCAFPESPLLKTPKGWLIGFIISSLILAGLVADIGYLIWTGVGIWGNNNPVYWGWAIVNFVFWVGLGHAWVGHAQELLVRIRNFAA